MSIRHSMVDMVEVLCGNGALLFAWKRKMFQNEIIFVSIYFVLSGIICYFVAEKQFSVHYGTK